ncbi:dipeptidase [Actinocorallia sp. A-T 12471]|uniref:dipeptidase n=1 Tax=Actinocorallia sp. A-T 12471 TaxID=3089813 RepID=UPI0029CCCBBF|nr:dipeptidase [Actinocorallia sp. A-T 12471]MDX6744728.1 dipeptidase [Actinocorallia sp. A-T 12471]
MGAELSARVRGLMGRARDDLAELVAFRSVYDPGQYPEQECVAAARWVVDACADVGLTEAGLHEMPDGSVTVVARKAAPEGKPTVLLYCHYDVQPPGDETAWLTDPWHLTDQPDGRWYGRGAADCKGNLVMHLTALRALGPDLPVGVVLVAEGSEEQGGAGLEDFVPEHPDLTRADVILVADCGNVAVGEPTFTRTLRGTVNVVVAVDTLRGPVHSGSYGGPAPDALVALIRILDSLHDDEGNVTVQGLESGQTWDGVGYPEGRFRADAGVLDGVALTGGGSVADHVWARPALTVLGVDCPPVAGSAAAVQAHARARLNLRVPPGTDGQDALRLLTEHVKAAAPWQVKVTVEPEAVGEAFSAHTGGPAYNLMSGAFKEVFGKEPVSQGQGGSIPLCTVFQRTYPDAEIMLFGVEEPACLIHAPNESVDPAEIERFAHAEALFLSSL